MGQPAPHSSPSAPGRLHGTSASGLSESDLVAAIEARMARLGQDDHYAVLGLAPNATREEVKSAFIALAKVFHPDRLPASLAHLERTMAAVFESIRGAYETLSDEVRRSAWEATRTTSPGGSSALEAQQAAEFIRQGETAFKKRNYRVAEDAFRAAHALDGKAESLAARAWAIYMDPSRKAEAVFAKGLMQQALGIDPTCDRAHYQLGVIARVEGDTTRAEAHFREAVQANPRHLEAAQEIRLIEMRKKKHDSGAKKLRFPPEE